MAVEKYRDANGNWVEVGYSGGGGGGGESVTVDSELSATSTNPVQNKVITAELNKKVNSVSGKGLSTNDYTTSEKNKLSGIATGAQVNVQSDWNATSGDAYIKNKPTFATVNGQRIDQGGEIVVEGGGSGITVDSYMSDTSENPVQNKVVKTYVDEEVENAKAYADSKIGDIDTLLDSINGEII